MYTYMLEGIQGALPSRFTIVLKDMKKECREAANI